MADLSKIAVSNNEYDIPQGGDTPSLVKNYGEYNLPVPDSEITWMGDQIIQDIQEEGLYLVCGTFAVTFQNASASADVEVILGGSFQYSAHWTNTHQTIQATQTLSIPLSVVYTYDPNYPLYVSYLILDNNNSHTGAMPNSIHFQYQIVKLK